MRAGEAARRAGVNVETLRYYERRGLLPEPARTPNGHRRYDEESVRFLRAIKDVQAIGFTLAEIEEYLRVARRGNVPGQPGHPGRGPGGLGRASPPRTLRARRPRASGPARTALPGPGARPAA